MIKHKNIPFFIPHSGCKNNCVFCSQTKITGFSLPDGDIIAEARRLKSVVDEALCYLGDAEAQIGFFGGSFTGIEPRRMLLLLDTAYEYVKNKKVSGIRLSTRPDYIDEDILALLKARGVTDIELGLQSTDENVLAAAGRGHGREICFKSAKLITDYGFRLGGQMMIGLPLSDEEKEIQTAKDIVAMGASCARIYPTVVFAGTELYEMTLSGVYKPISNDVAVRRSAECLRIFKNADVDMLRIGLHASAELAAAPYGANHPAMGEMVYAYLTYCDICEKIGSADTCGKILKIFAPPKTVSSVAGLRAENKKKLKDRYGFKAIKIYKSESISDIKVLIEAEE